MHPLVSVIVPVYKVEKYLARCLDSLCGQSLQDIEFILIDDASPDNCGKICEEYAAKDVRFKVIHHAENRGLSKARNTGIKRAIAEFIMFVDSDDCVHKDFCKLAYECAVQNASDLVLFKRKLLKPSETFVFYDDSKECLPAVSQTQIEALELTYGGSVGPMAWNKLYRKHLFSDISYPSGMLYEDIGTTYKIILKADSIYYLDKILYYNFLREGSLTTLRNEKALHDWFTMSKQFCRDIMSWGAYPADKLDLFIKNEALAYCIKKKKDLSDPDYVNCADLLQSCKTIPKGFSFKRKILFVLFKYCLPIFEMVCSFYGTKWA